MKLSRRGFLKSLSAIPLAVAMNRVNAVSEADYFNGTIIKFKPENTNTGLATAWVNFDGSKNPPEILGSYGVESVERLGVGEYRINPSIEIKTHNDVVMVTNKSDDIVMATKKDDVVGVTVFK